jgi:hypothetical protein
VILFIAAVAIAANFMRVMVEPEREVAESHLSSAAAALRWILARRHPEYSWVVGVEPRNGHDPAGMAAAAPDGERQARAVADDADALGQHDARPAGSSPSSSAHDHRVDQAA